MKRFYTIMNKGFLLLISLIFVLSGTSLHVSAEGYTVSTIDPNLKGSVTVQKFVQDSQNQDQKVPLVGTEYRITYRNRLDESEVKTDDSDYYQAIAVTDRNGNASFKDLELGVYLVEEIGGILSGYETCNPFLVSVPMTNQTEATYDGVTYEAGTIWIYDVIAAPKNEHIYGRVELLKYDAEDQTLLKGAVFQLFYKNGDPFLTESGEEVKLVTDEQGKIVVNDLPYGNYYFLEIEAPVGYKRCTEKLFFDILQSYIEGDEDTIVKLEVENEKMPEDKYEESTEPDTISPPQTETGSKTPGNPTTPSTPGKQTETTGKKTLISPVKTADESDILLWILLLTGAISTEVYLKLRKRRQGSKTGN